MSEEIKKVVPETETETKTEPTATIVASDVRTKLAEYGADEATIDKVVDADMDRVIDINTKGTMYCMRAASNKMLEAGGGSIVNVASVAGVMGCGGAAYVASKAAVIGITKHAALRFAGTGVRCNAVCPGTIVTPMVAGMNPANMDADMFGQMAKHSDLKIQPCMPEDVANILLFLATDESRAITGQAIVSDFGSSL